jgi:hypothetical protein
MFLGERSQTMWNRTIQEPSYTLTDEELKDSEHCTQLQMDFNTEEHNDPELEGPLHRMMAYIKMEQDDMSAAEVHIRHAETKQPEHQSTHILRCTHSIRTKNDCAAKDALAKLLLITDHHQQKPLSDVLRSIAAEATKHEQTGVLVDCYKHLYLTSDTRSESAREKKLTILRRLVELTVDTKSMEAVSSVFELITQDTAKILRNQPDQEPLIWLRNTAWNLAIQALQKQEHKPCHTLFMRCALLGSTTNASVRTPARLDYYS